MADSKKLYFIPIIAQALDSDDPKRAMKRAFDEIQQLGNQPEYQKGYRQFLEFVKTAVKPSGEKMDRKNQMIRNAIHRLIYDLVTDTFDGDEGHKNALMNAIMSDPEWGAEYERIKNEARDYLASEATLEIEVLKDDHLIGSVSAIKDSDMVGPIFPGKYSVRFSNGRVLWEGDITREDVIWTYAFPGKDLPMAAETEPLQQEPTRTLTFLDGELTIYVFAGLESGRLRIKSGYDI